MNKYLQKIQEIARKFINHVKANELKKKILQNNIASQDEKNLDTDVVDLAIMDLVLQDEEVIQKLYEDKTLFNYVFCLKDDDQLSFFNNHIDMFKEDINSIYERLLDKINIKKILNTQLGSRVIDAFPLKAYEKIKDLTEEEIEAINNQGIVKISLEDIAGKAFQKEKGDKDWKKKYAFLCEKTISIKDKISVLKKKKESLIIDATEIIGLPLISDKDKKELINSLNLECNVKDWIWYSNSMSDELKKFLISRPPESNYKDFADEVVLEDPHMLSYDSFERICKNDSILSDEKISSKLNFKQKEIRSLVNQLASNFKVGNLKERQPIIEAFLKKQTDLNF